jgi:hypothetical protein
MRRGPASSPRARPLTASARPTRRAASPPSTHSLGTSARWAGATRGVLCVLCVMSCAVRPVSCLLRFPVSGRPPALAQSRTKPSPPAQGAHRTTDPKPSHTLLLPLLLLLQQTTDDAVPGQARLQRRLPHRTCRAGHTLPPAPRRVAQGGGRRVRYHPGQHRRHRRRRSPRCRR